MTWLNDMRILAALAIISVHYTITVQGLIPDTQGLAYWSANVYASFSFWGVPVFVMISGAILLNPEKEYSSILSFYKKRVNRLLIPILFWTLFYLIWSIAKNSFLGREYTLDTLLNDLLIGRPFYHMWYLYMVIGLYLFTPFLKKIVKYSSYKELLFLTFMLFVISLTAFGSGSIFPHHSNVFILMFPIYLSYFFAGYLIIESRKQFDTKILLLLFISFGLITLAGRHFNINGSGLYFYNNFSVFIIGMSVTLMFLIKNLHYKYDFPSHIIAKVASFSLGAYLVHPAVIDIIKRLHYFGISPVENPLLTIPLFIIIITTISLSIAFVFSKVKYLNKTV